MRDFLLTPRDSGATLLVIKTVSAVLSFVYAGARDLEHIFAPPFQPLLERLVIYIVISLGMWEHAQPIICKRK